MTPAVFFATALLASTAANECRGSTLTEARAIYFGTAIVSVAKTIDEQAALGVLACRESGFDRDVETCRRVGDGGWGSWQLNDDVGNDNCADVVTQARAT